MSDENDYEPTNHVRVFDVSAWPDEPMRRIDVGSGESVVIARKSSMNHTLSYRELERAARGNMNQWFHITVDYPPDGGPRQMFINGQRAYVPPRFWKRRRKAKR